MNEKETKYLNAELCIAMYYKNTEVLIFETNKFKDKTFY
jgi:hypothetical protein